jgi:hypothetical protein
MPPTASATGGGRLYLLYDSPAMRPQTFAFGGVFLVEARRLLPAPATAPPPATGPPAPAFPTVDEAKARVAEDIRQRDRLRAFAPMGRPSRVHPSQARQRPVAMWPSLLARGCLLVSCPTGQKGPAGLEATGLTARTYTLDDYRE